MVAIAIPNYAAITVQVEFVAGVWSTLPYVPTASASRGRTYELDSPTAGTLNLSIDCSDGNLDPTNPGSIYYPNVRLNKRCRIQVTWAGVTKSLFTGYVERYPQRWEDAGSYQWTELVVVDPFAVMNRRTLEAVAYPTIAYYNPAMWWALDDAAGSTLGGSRVGGMPLTLLATRAGGSTATGPFFAFGATPSKPTPGMENNTAAGFTPGPNALTVSPADMTVLRSPANQRVIPGAGPWTVYCSATSTAPNLSGVAPNGTRVMVLNSFDGSAYIAFGVSGTDRTGTYIVDSLGVDVGSSAVSITYAYPPDLPGRGPWNNGYSHYWAVSLSADQKTLVFAVSDAAVLGYVTKNDGSNWDFSVITSLSVGGEFRPYRNGNFAYNAWTGTVSNVVIWNTEQISSGGIGDIVRAEMLGYYGDNTMKRFQRLMGFTGPRYVPYVNSPAGLSSSGYPLWKGKSLTSALGELSTDEGGPLYVDGSGTINFSNRQVRINPKPTITLTDQGADGPGVYRYTGITTDYDNTRLINDVTVKRNNGVTAHVIDAQSVLNNGSFTRSIAVNIADDQQAIDRASYTLTRNSQPLPRISSVTLSPGNDPNLWPLVTSLDLNQAVTVVRTPSMGHSFSRICWVERVSYSMDAANGTFIVTLQLSPADINTYLVLDDAVAGRLDSGNELGY